MGFKLVAMALFLLGMTHMAGRTLLYRLFDFEGLRLASLQDDCHQLQVLVLRCAVDLLHIGVCKLRLGLDCVGACSCPLFYESACGVNGATYPNKCFAACEGVQVACSGMCPCTRRWCPCWERNPSQ